MKQKVNLTCSVSQDAVQHSPSIATAGLQRRAECCDIPAPSLPVSVSTLDVCASVVLAAEPLPQTDPEIMDWMSDIMTDAAAAGSSKPSSAGGELSFINYNTGYEYSADLGFFVALDGAARLSRLLPAAGLVSYSPPGSLYQVRCTGVGGRLRTPLYTSCCSMNASCTGGCIHSCKP